MDPVFVTLEPEHELTRSTVDIMLLHDLVSHSLVLPELPDHRGLISLLLQRCIWMDLYYEKENMKHSLFYKDTGIKTVKAFENDSFVPYLLYNCIACVDTVSRRFHFDSEEDDTFSPLHKEYQYFMEDQEITCSKYRENPFYVAVQRTVYLWLIQFVEVAEFCGRFAMPVCWAYEKKGKYRMNKCRIMLEFDLRDSKVVGRNVYNFINLRLGRPYDLSSRIVESEGITSKSDFFREFWHTRLAVINKQLETMLYGPIPKVDELGNSLLHCYETINEV